MEEFSLDEQKRLQELDSTWFGFINLAAPESCSDRLLVGKAIRHLEQAIRDARLSAACPPKEDHQPFSAPVDSSSVVSSDSHDGSAEQYCKLGHLLLLVNDYPKALSAYQLCFRRTKENAKDSSFLYGLGLAYFHFNRFDWARQLFNRVLYVNPKFIRSNEIHYRLGVISKHEHPLTLALKQFKLALNDNSDSTYSKADVRFHIAHCYELQGDFLRARDDYNNLINSPPQLISNSLKASLYRQLGWLYAIAEVLGDKTQRTNLAIQFLQDSLKLDPSSGESWYYLGRCLSNISNKAQDAFLAYRHSIDKSESSADTWASIGVLYQLQNQFTDALQAYICAVQLDKEHSAAWIDLGLLYEHCRQPKDALQCYIKALSNHPNESLAVKIQERIDTIELALTSAPLTEPSKKSPLPSLEEAWKLPIPAELTIRQDQIHQNKLKHYFEGSPLYLSIMKGPVDEQFKEKPSYYLNHHQLQMLHVLQQNQTKLTSAELATMTQLQQRFIHMQNHMRFMHERQQELQLAAFAPEMSYQQQTNATAFAATNGSSRTEFKLEAADLPEFTREDIQELLGSTDCKQEDDLLSAFHDQLLGKDAPINDPILTTASIDLGLNQDFEMSSNDVDNVNRSDEVVHVEVRPPDPLCLTADCFLNIKQPASDVVAACKRASQSAGQISLFGSAKPPCMPTFQPVTDNKLLIPTPTVIVETKKEAHSAELQEFCNRNPVVVIRGMSTALKLDLGLFSTKTLVETAPNSQIEIRTQNVYPPEVTYDNYNKQTWTFDSHRSYTTIVKYAEYQAQTFQQALREEQERLKGSSSRGLKGSINSTADSEPFCKRRKEAGKTREEIKFGTNVDLSDDKKWRTQLQELNKLPGFCRLNSSFNMLTHLGFVVFGMNTVQLYMKVPGCRTPGHQENNNFASVNINIGPGDCEWFSVPFEYWGCIQKMCEQRGIDYLNGSWWPVLDDLAAANIPLYRYTQKPGDLVWVTPGTVHWVQSMGWCNNIAWYVYTHYFNNSLLRAYLLVYIRWADPRLSLQNIRFQSFEESQLRTFRLETNLEFTDNMNVGPVTAMQLELAIDRYEYNKLVHYKSIVPCIHLCWQLAKNIRFTDEKMFAILKAVLLKSLCYMEMAVAFAVSLGKSLIHSPREQGEVAHYCELCEREVFNVLFCTPDDRGKLIVHCLDCVRHKTDDLLSTVHVVYQYELADLEATYDKFRLHSKVPGICV